MTPADISNAKNPDLRASVAAMRRAAELARRTAIQTDTAIIMVRDGKPVRIPAHQLRRAQDGGGVTSSQNGALCDDQVGGRS